MSFGWIQKFNLKILAVGHFVFHSLDYAFDYVLYPYVIYKLGVFSGCIAMAFLSAAVCLFIAFVYDLLEKDWLGIEAVRELVENFFQKEEEYARKNWRRISEENRFLGFSQKQNRPVRVFVFAFRSAHNDDLYAAGLSSL